VGYLIDTNVASELRKAGAAHPMVDGLLAATAIVHNLILVTRNTRDVARTGVKLLNPVDEPSSET
jgi:predicted nucleic acid-binding protein